MRNHFLPKIQLAALSTLGLIGGACSTTPSTDAAQLDDASAGPAAPAPAATGRIVPGEHAVVSIWPEAYSGELLVLEVRPEGTAVVEGDVLAKLDTRSIEEQIAAADLEFQSARVAHDGLLEKNRMAEETAIADLARARASLERSRQAFEGYESKEVEFSARVDTLSAQRDQYRVDDQRDELAQLEAMYEADELTDATEEIVLKRSQRNLQLTLDSNALAKDRRQFRNELAQRHELESRREALARETQNVEHMERNQAIARAAREDAEKRSVAAGAKKEERLQRLKRDLELFTIRAPGAGILMHGKWADYRPGKSHSRLQRASKIATRTDILMIVDPSRLAVAMEIKESSRQSLADGSRVLVQPMGGNGGECTGTLTVAELPTGQQGDEATFAGNIALDSATPDWIIGTRVSVNLESATE